MSGWTIAAASVLGAGVGVTWLSVVGLLRCRDAFDRLHLSGLASLYAPWPSRSRSGWTGWMDHSRSGHG